MSATPRVNGTTTTIPVRRFRRPIGTRLPVLQSEMLPQAVPINVCSERHPTALQRWLALAGTLAAGSVLTLLVLDALGRLAP